MAACKSAIERKTPRRMRCRVILEKKSSTALSQEAEVGVKWNVQRGWRDDKFRGAGYVVKCDHPSVIEAAWPAEALAITEAGRTALAKHRAEIAGNKGRRRSGDKRVIFRRDRTVTSSFWGTIGSGLYGVLITGLGTMSTRQWRIPVTPRPEKEPVSYCAAAMSVWFAMA